MDFVKKIQSLQYFMYTFMYLGNVYKGNLHIHAILPIFRINIQALHVYATTAVSMTIDV